MASPMGLFLLEALHRAILINLPLYYATLTTSLHQTQLINE